MDIEFSEAADINVEVQALNLDGIKQNLLDYVQDQAKIDIADSVDKADKSAKSAEAYAGEAATSATTASECAEQTSVNLGLYYKKSETDVLLNAKAAKATTLAGYGITDAYTKTQVDSSLSGKASTSLDNLTADGQMIIDTQNGTISNCVLEIPQNIKVTLENNVLTVKSGSILTLTGDTYATATTNHDVARTYNSLADGRYFIFMAGNLASLGAARKISEVGSGDTVPDSSSSLTAFYNTADKKMYQKENNVWTVWNVVYPLCIIEASDGAVSFAKDSKGNDMIFNGAGFIGHHAFVYPNVRKLICKGKADSKLNSYDELVNGLYIVDLGQSIGTRAVISRNSNTYFSNIYWEVDKYSDLVAQAGVQYCRETNYCYSYTNGIFNEQSRLALAYITHDGTTVTDFTIRQPYQGARNLLTDDLYKQIGDVETLLATV